MKNIGVVVILAAILCLGIVSIALKVGWSPKKKGESEPEVKP